MFIPIWVIMVAAAFLFFAGKVVWAHFSKTQTPEKELEECRKELEECQKARKETSRKLEGLVDFSRSINKL